VARKSHQSGSPEVLQTHTQSFWRKSCVYISKGNDEDDFVGAHKVLQREGLDRATEEEATCKERVAQSKAMALALQL
jgi:hypothetical protein